MTKKVKISFLVLVWSIVAVQMYVNHNDQMKLNQAVTAFSVVDENVTGEVIKGYGYFGAMEISDEMKKNMLKNLALKMGIEDGYTFSEGKGDDFVKMILTKEGKYASTTIQIISLMGAAKPEQYISLQIETAADVEEAFGLYDRTKQVFEEIEVNSQVSMELEMEQQGNLWKESGDTFVKQLLDMAQAKEVDRIIENEIYTIYGQSKLSENYLTLDDKKVNVQVVMFYDETADKTYIKMGIPIVNSSY